MFIKQATEGKALYCFFSFSDVKSETSVRLLNGTAGDGLQDHKRKVEVSHRHLILIDCLQFLFMYPDHRYLSNCLNIELSQIRVNQLPFPATRWQCEYQISFATFIWLQIKKFLITQQTLMWDKRKLSNYLEFWTFFDVGFAKFKNFTYYN